MFLIIETASARALIAICDNTHVIAQKNLSLALSSSADLEPSLQVLLEEVGIKPSDLQFVAVGQGPGSYTGLRVGAASAKGISIGCGIPLVGISSLKGFLPPLDFFGPYLAVIDAKIGGVYVQSAIKNKDGITFLGSEELLPFCAFTIQLEKTPTLVTPAFAPLEKRLKGISAPQVFECGPSADQLFLESKTKFENKDYTNDGTLPLLYLRLTQAEMEKLPNKGQFQ